MPPFDGGMQVGALGRQYQIIGASQIAAPLGPSPQFGDTLDQIWIFPATTSPGSVTILDGAITVWTFPAITLTDNRAIFVPLNLRSVTTGWRITTGLSVSVLASGIFG